MMKRKRFRKFFSILMAAVIPDDTKTRMETKMRRFSPLAVLFCLIFLTACTAQADRKEEKDAARAAMTESTAKEEQTAVFQATVLEVSESDCLVEPVEGSTERKSADRIRISTDEFSVDTPMPGIGDVIEITYDGWIAETYPAQIRHVSAIRILTPASHTDQPFDENEENGAEIIDGDNFSAQILGDELILDLKSNATTGYTWVITEEPTQFASDYDVYVEPDNTNGMVGAGGTTEFHIIALQEGTGTMVFQYKRNWEGGDVAGIYELTLKITDNLQIESASFEQVK